MKYCRYLVFLIVILFSFKSDFGGLNGSGETKSSKQKNDSCPVIDASMMVIKPSTCRRSDGAITGITVTGGNKVFFTWRDGDNQVVKNTLDLTDVPAGDYSLEVKDVSSCSHPMLNLQVIEKNGINIDEKNVVIKKAGCNNEGSITGLNVVGATTYQWYCFDTGITYTSQKTPDIFNLATGTYKLTAFNSSCSKTSSPYAVQAADIMPVVASYRIVTPVCGLKNDSLIVLVILPKAHPALTFYFIDDHDQQVSVMVLQPTVSTPEFKLGGIRGGFYRLYVKGTGCDILLGTFAVTTSPFEISLKDSHVLNDKCNEHAGMIDPVFAYGLIPPPKSLYYWTDEATNTVVSTDKVLRNVGKGTYRLGVINNTFGCAATAVFMLVNESPEQIPPVADGFSMCLPGIGALNVKNVDTRAYIIYTLH
jgi:hypothetical protein